MECRKVKCEANRSEENMQAVSLAGSNFLTLVISYQLEVQDDENFI